MRKSIVTLFFILFLTSSAWATFLPGGYYQAEVDVFSTPESNVVGFSQKLRLKFGEHLNKDIYINLETEYDSTGGDVLALIESTNNNRITIERLYLLYYTSFGILTAGRQKISWGTTYFFNPTDAFENFSLTLTDNERDPTDAIRLQTPLGQTSGIELIYYPISDSTAYNSAVKVKTNWGLFDYSASYVSQGDTENNIVGADFTGEWMGLGVRGEGTRTYPRNADAYFTYVLGFDYTLDNGLYLITEYFRNGIGKSAINQYDWNSFLQGQLFFKAKEYSFISLRQEIYDLMYLNISSINNLNDGSSILYPSIDYNWFADMDITLGALLMQGNKGTEYKPAASQDPTGLLGNNFYFLKLKYSF